MTWESFLGDIQINVYANLIATPIACGILWGANFLFKKWQKVNKEQDEQIEKEDVRVEFFCKFSLFDFEKLSEINRAEIHNLLTAKLNDLVVIDTRNTFIAFIILTTGLLVDMASVAFPDIFLFRIILVFFLYQTLNTVWHYRLSKRAKARRKRMDLYDRTLKMFNDKVLISVVEKIEELEKQALIEASKKPAPMDPVKNIPLMPP